MNDTAISNINKIIWIKINKIKNIDLVKLFPDDPKSDKRRCPATILAVKRIDRVIGRIIKLMNSIIVIKGIKIKGVLEGVRWVNISL